MEEKILNALGNPVRLKLLCCLAQSPKNVEGLIENCELSQSAVSQHLSKLKEAGLVKKEKKGRYVYYFLNDSKTGEIAQNLKKYIEEVN